MIGFLVLEALADGLLRVQIDGLTIPMEGDVVRSTACEFEIVDYESYGPGLLGYGRRGIAKCRLTYGVAPQPMWCRDEDGRLIPSKEVS